MRVRFDAFARKVAEVSGSVWTFVLALSVVVGWAVSGPFLGFSDLWQLSINTGTTIVTFLMVFLIQNSQNHDTRALHTKLDGLLEAIDKADDGLIAIEKEDDQC